MFLIFAGCSETQENLISPEDTPAILLKTTAETECELYPLDDLELYNYYTSFDYTNNNNSVIKLIFIQGIIQKPGFSGRLIDGFNLLEFAGGYGTSIKIELPAPANSISIDQWRNNSHAGFIISIRAYNEDGVEVASIVSPNNTYGRGLHNLFLESGTGNIKYVIIEGISNRWVRLRNLQFCYESACPAQEVAVEADKTTLWPPNNKEVNVTFSGSHLNRCENGTYTLVDEYGEYSYTGIIENCEFSIPLLLKAARDGNDAEGRKYTFTVTSSNDSGEATKSVEVIVLHDNGKIVKK